MIYFIFIHLFSICAWLHRNKVGYMDMIDIWKGPRSFLFFQESLKHDVTLCFDNCSDMKLSAFCNPESNEITLHESFLLFTIKAHTNEVIHLVLFKTSIIMKQSNRVDGSLFSLIFLNRSYISGRTFLSLSGWYCFHQLHRFANSAPDVLVND